MTSPNTDKREQVVTLSATISACEKGWLLAGRTAGTDSQEGSLTWDRDEEVFV